MPRIPDGILESVIYLYPSVVDAQNGESTGGTGFLVAVECQRYNGVPATIYAVTNSHVIREGQSPIVRLNTHNNRTEVLRLDTSTWMHHPEGDDVAICQLELSSIHKYRAIPWTELIAAESIDEWDIGPGDDVFFVGRFMRHDGKQQNLPTARFGNISMLPLEPILHGRGHEVEAFRVEARSLSGYSGSPVWIMIPPGPGIRSYLLPHLQDKKPKEPGLDLFLALLGLDFGHEPDYKRVLDQDKHPLTDVMWVEQNSGIMNVVPAWKILELLNSSETIAMREDREQTLYEHAGRS